MTPWTILCDFDGTISTRDVTDALLERFADPGWEALERQWRGGQLGSLDCLAGQIALIDASPQQLHELIDSIAIDGEFASFAAAARAAGAGLVVVSDGLDVAIQRILGKAGLSSLPVRANALQQAGERRWQCLFPHANRHCRTDSGHCKCATAAGLAATRRTLLVGDGQSDCCLAGQVDFVFAKDRLLDYCRRQNLPHAPIANFGEALTLLPALLAGELTADSVPTN